MLKFRKPLTLAALISLLALVPTPALAADSSAAATAKLVSVSAECELAVAKYLPVKGCDADTYLVEFQDHAAQVEFEHYLRRDLGASLQSTAISAFELSSLELANLAREPKVQAITANAQFRKLGTQASPGWHLDRIDQATLPLDQTYNFQEDAQGAGVVIYIVDTGINSSHSEFSSRLGQGIGYLADGTATSAEDCNGHGTHVAGLAGGTTFGPAKLATVTPVRVLDCDGNGTLLSVLSGLDWIAQNTLVGQPAVVNMSLGGQQNAFLDNAVSSLSNQGLVFVVAAGNSSAEACSTSPASVSAAITVASSDQGDEFSSFSNFGSCVDVVAPGGLVQSAWTGGPNSSAVGSGTSMASGLVAGLVANHMSFGYQTPEVLKAEIVNKSVSGVLTAVPADTPNLLVQNTVTLTSGGSATTDFYNRVTLPGGTAPDQVSVPPVTEPAPPSNPGSPGGSLPILPPAPTAPTVSVVGSSATISWVIPVQTGLVVNSQTIRISSGTTLVLETALPSDATSYLFEGLAPGVIYTAQISITSSAGASPLSNPSVGFSFVELLNSPTAGEFSAWTKLLANRTQVKFYAKYPQVGQKIQFMVQRSNGSYRELAWLRIEAKDLTETGEYRNLTNGIYFVRTVNLNLGKNRLRILVDGQLLGSTKTYSLRR